LVDPFRAATRVELVDLQSDSPSQPHQVEQSDEDARLADLQQSRTARLKARALQAVADAEEPDPLLPAAIRMKTELESGIPSFLDDVLTGDVADAPDPDTAERLRDGSGEAGHGWHREFVWAGLYRLPAQFEAQLAMACAAELAQRVGYELQEQSTAESWQDVNTLMDAGSSDPVFPLRARLDVGAIAAAERRWILDVLVVWRSSILASVSPDGTAVAPDDDSLAVVAEQCRVAMRRSAADKTPPDAAWAESASALIRASREMDARYALCVAGAAVTGLPYPTWHEDVCGEVWDLVDQVGPRPESHDLVQFLCRRGPNSWTMTTRRWTLLTGVARELREAGSRRDALDVLECALGHELGPAQLSADELCDILCEYAEILKSDVRIIGAANAYERAADAATAAALADRADSCRMEAQRCLALLGHR
jgi:hypothetical protein